MRTAIRRIDESMGTSGRGRMGLAAFRTHLKGAAEIVAEEARNRAPVRSGTLKSKIRARVSGDRAMVVALARNPRDKYPYPRRLEYEPPPRGRPFLGPALEAKREEVAREMEKVLDSIEKAWGK